MKIPQYALLMLLIVAGLAASPFALADNVQALRCLPLPDGGMRIEFALDKPQRVSAAVYDASQRLVRELLRGEALAAGDHALTWDGLDSLGQPQPPGVYEARVLATPGLRAEYVTSLGIRPGSAPYDSWVGNHGGTAAIAIDETGVYASATVTETAPVLLKMSLDGRTRHWTRGRGDVTRGRFQGGVAMASDQQGRLYMLQQNGYLQVIDAAEGRRIATWDVMPPATTRNSQESNQTYRHGQTIADADLAAHGNTLVLSQRDRNLLTWLDPENGEPLATVELNAPAGLALAPDGTVFAIAGDKVYDVAPEGIRRVVIEGLDAPSRIAYEPSDQTLLVAEWGDSHQIHRYALDGARIATYGRAGGRLEGTYIATDFLQVTAISADGRGGFVVAEQAPAPRRVAHVDRDGALINEWYGGQPYYAWGAPDPRDPTSVWFNAGSWLTLARLDPAQRTWHVLETYNQNNLAGGLMRTVSGHQGRWHVLYHQDQRYLVSESAPQVLLHEAGRLRALTVVGSYSAELAELAEAAGFSGAPKSFRWVDANNDGIPQAGEFTFSESSRLPNGDRSVAANFELLTVSSGTEGDRAFVRVLRTRPTWDGQVPIYPFGDEPGVNEVAGDATVESPAGTGGTRGVGAYRDADGNYYAHYNTANDWHGTTWPTYWGGQSRLLRWNADGEERWRVGRHAIHGGLGGNPHTTPPGQIHVGAAIFGEVGETVVMADRVEWMGMVWTRDGLYVGNVLDTRTDDGLPDSVYYWWRTPDGEEAIVTSDNATGGAIARADDGTVYFFTQGRNSVPVYRIHGWDGWQRLAGTATLAATPAHAAGSGSGLRGDYYLVSPPVAETLGDVLEEALDLPPVADENPLAFAVEISGEPVATLVEPRIWHGSPHRQPANDQVIDGFRGGPAVNWATGVASVDTGGGAPPARPFAVRWSGEIEAPLSEEFTFSIYSRGGVRLWIDGQQLLFGWNESQNRRETTPITLTAGQRYPVQLDFYSSHQHPACSLNWESFSLDRQRIPTRHLYPETTAVAVPIPQARSAAARIDAATFDRTNIETDDARTFTNGLRHRGIGKPGAWLGFQRLDFGNGVTRLYPEANGSAAGNAGFAVLLAFRLGSPDGPTLAEVRLDEGIPPEGIAIDTPITGVHDLYLVNTTQGGWHFIRIGNFRFE